MRKFLIPLLLASAAFPATAIAADEDRDAARAARAEQRMERSQQRMERADRPERAARPDRADRQERQERAEPPQQQQQQQPQPQQQQQQAPREMRQMRVDRAPDAQAQGQAREIERQQRRSDRAPRNWVEGTSTQPTERRDDVVRDRGNRGPRVITTDGLPAEVRQDRQRGDRIDRGDRLQRGDRIDRTEERALARRTRMPGLPPMAVQGPRPGSGGGLVSTPLRNGGELRRSGSGSQWGTHWRNDRRYDWRDWRKRNRRSFNLSFYIDPFGFGYQRMNYGWRLFPSYYRSNYWLNDPWQYRLPPAYGPYRWVRYWDDALLVDTYSGEVVDVIHDFFW